MFNLLFKLLFSPNDASGTGTGVAVEDNKMSHEDMIDFISDEGTDDETKPEIIELEEGPTKGKVSEREEGEEETESDEDEKPEQVEDDEIIVPVRRKEILAKYPNLFKDFPHLDKAVYREQQYSEILPTLDDAKEAADARNTLSHLNHDLENGSTVKILKAVKSANPDTFNGMVDNYLGQLKEVDEGAYYHVLSNVIKHTIIAMANTREIDTQEAAKILNHFVFGPGQFVPPFNLSKETGQKDEKTQELETREIEFRREVLDTHVNSINTRIENSVKSTIDKNIDPRESMTPFTRKQAIRECEEKLETEIGGDTRFRGLLDKLWERAAEEGFNPSSLDKIKSAYLSKAKTLLPTIIRSVRNEALRTKRNVDVDDNPRRGPLPVGSTRKSTPTQARQTSSGNSDKDKARTIPKGMRSIDFLMKD